jgi:uncharacterized protein YkwD
MALALPTSAAADDSGPMISKINQVRANHGLARLRPSRSLLRSSRAFSRYLMAHNVFGHRSRVSASLRFRWLGEALALHFSDKPEVAMTVRMWLDSPPHRRIVLAPQMRLIGVGLCRGTFRGERAAIWVLQVGRL